ncbi:MAG: hypothetical protein ABH934_01760 [Chloroflexota bacterium]
MRNLNLKVALIIYGAIHIVQGIILLVAPERLTELAGFEALGSSEYFLAIIGGAFIAAGVWFAITGLNPLQNINGVRFAILWAGLLLVVPLFTLWYDYVDFGHIWFMVVQNAIFAAAFLIFYPYRR